MTHMQIADSASVQMPLGNAFDRVFLQTAFVGQKLQLLGICLSPCIV